MWLNCREVTELATEAAEGRLPAARRLLFALHRLTCRGCRASLDQLAGTPRALGRLEEEALSDDNKRKLLDALTRKRDDRPR